MNFKYNTVWYAWLCSGISGGVICTRQWNFGYY